MESNELIKVVQLPVIEQRLRELKENIERQTSDALVMVCTEETIKDVKKVRAELNKQFQALEEQRKAVKKAITAPYSAFEEVYKECVSDAYKSADVVLRGKIAEVEAEQKKRCEDELRAYFSEMCELNHVEWLQYEQVELTIDSASAKASTPKRLMKKIKGFVEFIARNISLIDGMEYETEILVEYKNCLNVAEAISIVNDRHKRIQQESESAENRKKVNEEENEHKEMVESISAPVVVDEKSEDALITCTFTLKDTKERLIALRQWLDENNYKYN